MVELALSLPLVLTFLIGTFGVGRALSQIHWMSQTAYLVALAGATSSPTTGGVGKMQSRFDTLRLVNRDLSRNSQQLNDNPINPVYDMSGSIPTGVTVTFSGNIGPIFGVSTIPLTVQVSGPVLSSSTSNLGNLSVPTTDRLYDCDGVPLPPGSPANGICVPVCSESDSSCSFT